MTLIYQGECYPVYIMFVRFTLEDSEVNVQDELILKQNFAHFGSETKYVLPKVSKSA